MIWLVYYITIIVFWGLFAGFAFGGVSTFLAIVTLMLLLGVLAKMGLELRAAMTRDDVRGYTILGVLSLLFTTLPYASAFVLATPALMHHCDLSLSPARIPCMVMGLDLGTFTLGLWVSAVFTVLTIPVFLILAAVSFGYVIYARIRGTLANRARTNGKALSPRPKKD